MMSGKRCSKKLFILSDTDPGYFQDTTAWPLGNIIPDTVKQELTGQRSTGITKSLVNDSDVQWECVCVHGGT